MSLYPILGAFLAGVVVTLAITFGLAYLTMRSNPSPSGAAPDGGEAMTEAEDPLFTCEYHDRAFHDAEEARDHAIEYHNAPKDGETWKHTYPEGRE